MTYFNTSALPICFTDSSNASTLPILFTDCFNTSAPPISFPMDSNYDNNNSVPSNDYSQVFNASNVNMQINNNSNDQNGQWHFN